ncbi:MAG: hypothetical protein E6767_16770 [Dysgonomonas sp.]|nr:hypothetical protein [Dysgonomonas sp.]
MLKSKNLLLIAFVACITGSLWAQTDSPYSRYGYGVLREQAVGPSKAMGGIGYGLRNSQSANPLNPASYSRVDSLTFLFDIGVSATRGKLSDGTNSDTKNSGRLDYITMLFPIKKNIGVSLGVLPYSSVGYEFGGSVTNGSISYTNSYSGTGGLSQVYLGLGYLTPIKGLSVGANVSYLFGVQEYNKGIAFHDNVSNNSSDNTEISLKTFKFDLGAQYEYQLSKKYLLTVGAVFSPKINSTADYENKHYDLNSGGYMINGDTTSIKGIDAGIPSTFGLGFTLNKENKLIFGADVTYQKWKDVKYSDKMNDGLSQSNRFDDRWKYNVGAEYMIDPYDRSFFKKMKFRGGLNYSNSYQKVKDINGKIDGYKEYGATVGFGFPFKDNFGGRTSYINLNFEYKKFNPNTKTMIKEEYFGVSVSVNINEFWFFRNKIQ